MGRRQTRCTATHESPTPMVVGIVIDGCAMVHGKKMDRPLKTRIVRMP